MGKEENKQVDFEGKSYSWEILNCNTAVKTCDPSFFQHHGTGIPMETKPFWSIEGLGHSQRKDIHIFYNGKMYDAYFSIDPMERARLFWHSDLQNELMQYSSAEPAAKAVFERVDDTLYNLKMVVGSEAAKCKKQITWIVPCSPEVYDCKRAFNELKKVNWQQSMQLSYIDVGDVVYIYSSSPVKAISHYCLVTKVNVPFLEIPDADYYVDKSKATNEGPFIELQCRMEFSDLPGLKLDELRKYGLKGNVQSPMKVGFELERHLSDMCEEQFAVDRIWGTNKQFSAPFKQSEYVPDADDEKVAPTLSDEALHQLAKAKETAKIVTRTVTTTQKTRDPYIAEYAKRRAKGICQLCGNPAPFTDKQGNPYLESHHIVWLSKGGTDTIDNTVALCPNCHRKMHVMDDPADVSKLSEKK